MRSFSAIALCRSPAAAASFLGYSAVVAFAAARAPLELLGAVAAGAVLGLVINYFGARILVFRPRG